MKRVMHVIVSLAVLTAGLGAQGGTRKQIEGIWKVTAIVVTGADASNVANAQPGLLIFTGRHYSMMYVTGNQPRAPFKAEEPTKDEKLAAFDSMVANSGTYELSGTSLTVRPVVARNPGFMTGGFDKYQFRIEGNTMTLTEKSTDFNFRMGQRVVPSSTAVSETRLTLTRVE
jgi:hypothetical protein